MDVKATVTVDKQIKATVNNGGISVDGVFASADIQTAIDHVTDTTAAHAASAISFAATGNISSTNVQSAIAEVDTEKAAKAGATFTGNITMSGASIIGTSASVASAATTDLSAVAADSVTITGTTAITSLGTMQAGAIKYLTFSGALTLTYNATSLITPTGASITTVAGDTAIAQSLGSGNWRIYNYARSSGAALSPVPAATSAEVATGTEAAKYVSPATAGYHRSAAKAWVNFNGENTVTINNSYNVSSISDGGTGTYTVNFTTAFANANYVCVGMVHRKSSELVAYPTTIGLGTMTTSACQVYTRNFFASALEDCYIVSLAFFGD